MQLEAPPLLQTKLDVPPPRAHMLARERLLSALPRALGVRLVLLSAPAGFGKTTLLAAWCRARLAQGDTAAAWLALDEGDNNPERFLTYLVAALRQAVGDTALGGLALPELCARGGEAILTQVVNCLAALDRGVVLVLDDYHLIGAPAVHAAVAFLIEHLPPRACLAIGSRADPPLPIARLRARDQLAELRAADLRFTPDEVQAFLAAGHLDLSAAEAQAIGAYAEGWPAGIQLVALALRAGACARAAELGCEPCDTPACHVIDRLDGSQQHVFEYLADDVFERQPAHRKAFLLKTAILDRLCGPLCDAILGIENEELRIEKDLDQSDNSQFSILNSQFSQSYSRLILEELEHANLFVMPLDGDRRWYRYHHLFRAFLRARLSHESPLAVADLHRRASAWYEQNGLIAQAVEHARAAGEHDRAALLAGPSRPSAQPCEAQRGAALAPRPPELAEPLSDREVEVLRLIAGGASNQAIAATLVISIGTVKSHINHILGKLGACNRTEAVSRARTYGLLAT
jgi:LuxR family maltose regulon positive regulatory protein